MINLLAAWLDLLQQFDLTTIVIILLLSFFAVLEISKGIDYFRKKRKQKEDSIRQEENRIVTLEALEQENEDTIEAIQADVEQLKRNVDTLLESDRENIKAWIVERYNYHKSLGYIDDYSLDTVEGRFKCYKELGGNSYAENLIGELRELHKRSFKDK